MLRSSARNCYALPPQKLDRMAAFANFLAEKDAIPPLKRRMRTFLESAQRISLIEAKIGDVLRSRLNFGSNNSDTKNLLTGRTPRTSSA